MKTLEKKTYKGFGFTGFIARKRDVAAYSNCNCYCGDCLGVCNNNCSQPPGNTYTYRENKKIPHRNETQTKTQSGT